MRSFLNPNFTCPTSFYFINNFLILLPDMKCFSILLSNHHVESFYCFASFEYVLLLAENCLLRKCYWELVDVITFRFPSICFKRSLSIFNWVSCSSFSTVFVLFSSICSYKCLLFSFYIVIFSCSFRSLSFRFFCYSFSYLSWLFASFISTISYYNLLIAVA